MKIGWKFQSYTSLNHFGSLEKDDIPAAPHQYEWRVVTLIVALICAIWISRTVVVVALCVGGCRSFLSCLWTEIAGLKNESLLQKLCPCVLQQMEPELSDFAVLDIFDTSQFLEKEKVHLAIYLLV